MCEYSPECTKQDDPLAVLLWEAGARHRAVFMVRCPIEGDELAALFDLPGRGKMLCAPAFRVLRRSLFRNPERPDDLAHFHAGLIPLTDFGQDEIEYARCARHGTWAYHPARIESRVFGVKDGQPFTYADYVTVADDTRTRLGSEESGID